MNNTVHIQIQTIILLPIRIRTRSIDGEDLVFFTVFAGNNNWLFLDDGGDDLAVLLGEPSEKGGTV
jgi:hypothetical protein